MRSSFLLAGMAGMAGKSGKSGKSGMAGKSGKALSYYYRESDIAQSASILGLSHCILVSIHAFNRSACF